MTEHEQLRQLGLRAELCDKHREIVQLEDANANLVIERDAADAVLDVLAGQR
jgi:hypothetical protein